MESRMEESILNHGVAISRIGDCEDDMNVCKNDVDTLKLEQASMGRDIRMLEGAMGGTQEDLENVSSQVDSFVSMTQRTSALVEGNACFLAEVQRGQLEVRGLAENLNQKFIRVNDIVDKKIVQMDEELDRVVGLVGEKIDTKMGEFSSDLMEALELEENRRKDLEAKVAFLEEKLVNSLTHTANLVTLILSIQARVSEVEDAVMEESEEGGEEVVSSSSSDLDPVENMVAIPVPALSVIHTLVEIPEEFVPLILQPSLAVPSTPSPEYVQALEDDPAHDGTPEYWADPEAGINH
jgi:paraquat-inducible protein B